MASPYVGSKRRIYTQRALCKAMLYRIRYKTARYVHVRLTTEKRSPAFCHVQDSGKIQENRQKSDTLAPLRAD